MRTSPYTYSQLKFHIRYKFVQFLLYPFRCYCLYIYGSTLFGGVNRGRRHDHGHCGYTFNFGIYYFYPKGKNWYWWISEEEDSMGVLGHPLSIVGDTTGYYFVTNLDSH